MPRPIRIQYPGAWHHVMNRRACGDILFENTYDRMFFLSLLDEAVTTTGIEIHAYCLMGNHYHLLVRTPEPSLDEAMRVIGGKYARYFNDRKGRDGTLCRSRYRSILIDSERYLLAVSRYIHRNPRALSVNELAAYSWSSYPAFLGVRPAQEWLSVEETLAVAGGRYRYEALVESPFPSEIEQYYVRPHVPSVIGSSEFKASLPRRGA